VHQFNRPDVSLHGPDAPKPYYGNYMPSKCKRSDARAVAVDRPDARSSRPDTLGYFGHNILLKD
jgi:hypothetical protein